MKKVLKMHLWKSKYIYPVQSVIK